VVTAGNAGPPRPRLAELVAALSLGIDLGFGQPMEHVLRQCVIALRLAERTGLDDDERLVVYYTALLISVGCFSDAHEQAKWFGDDIAIKADKYRYEMRGLRSAAQGMRRFGSGSPPLHRFRLGLEFALKGYRDLDGMVERHAAVAAELARHIGLPPAVQQALAASYEMWDGKGWPGTLAGNDIPIAARVSQFAEFMEVAHRVGGVEGATALARSRSGKQFDPALVAALCAAPGEMLRDLDTTSTWAMVVDNEPSLGVHLSEDEFDRALDAVAAFVDLKSPYFLGHSRAVADLVADAGTSMGLNADDLRTLRRAGLAHGFGRLGISN
jgi:HD-GYP domain-containing protein (c-di-GMP phosphodiesterase class II)